MEKNPYTFDSANARRVTLDNPQSKVMLASAVIFMYSMKVYQRRFFRKDGNLAYLMLFTGLSVPSSYSYANFFFNDAVTAAGMMNNEKEE